MARALKTRTDAWCLGFATGAGNPSDPHGWSLKLSRLSIVCQSASDRDPGSEVLGPTMQYGCKLRWRSPATMMALATGIIVALLWLREPIQVSTHSEEGHQFTSRFSSRSSSPNCCRIPVMKFPHSPRRLTDDLVPAVALSQQHRDRTWTKVFGKIVVPFFSGSATRWHAREIQL